MTGLIGWWPLHETEGDMAHDLSGKGSHGVVNGATQSLAGRSGLTAYSFDGESDYIQIADGKTVQNTSLTVTAWVYRSGEGDSGNYLSILNNTYDSPHNFSFYIHPDNYELAGWNREEGDSNSNVFISDYVIEENQWYHVSFVWNRPTKGMYIYANGELVDSFPDHGGEMKNSVTRYTIGQFADRDSYMFEGHIQDLRLYKRVLSPSEVKELYHMGSRDLHKKSLSDGSDVGAVSRWKLDDSGADGSMAIDSWGVNNGDINGSWSFVDDSVRNDGRSLRFSDGEIDTGFQFPTTDSPFTVSAWAKFEDLTDLRSVISSHEGGGVDEGFQIRYDDGDNAIRLATYDSDGNFVSANFSNPEKNVWYNIVGVYDGSNHDIYINGSHEDTLNLNRVATTTHNLFIGQAAGHDEPMKGNIDDVRIYDRALSSWEVFELYRWGSLGRDLRKKMVNKKGGVQ